jgi:hypothetical protein
MSHRGRAFIDFVELYSNFSAAHNLKVIGSNPIPATTDTDTPDGLASGVFFFAVFPMAWRSAQLRIVLNSPCNVA